jgi:hypothetical protein
MDGSLTAQQEALLAAVARGVSPDRAARDAGVSDKLWREWKKWPPFRQALGQASERAFAKGAKAIQRKSKPDKPPA